MSYFKPNGVLDRAALRRRVTQIIQPVWDPHLRPLLTIDPGAAHPHVVSAGQRVYLRSTPSGLAHVLPIETLVGIVYLHDVEQQAADTDTGWLAGLMRSMKGWPCHKALSFFGDRGAEARHHADRLADPAFAKLTAPASSAKAEGDDTDTTNTNAQESTMTAAAATMNRVDANIATILDAQMSALGLPPINTMIDDLNARDSAVRKLQTELKEAAARGKGLTVQIGGQINVPTGAGLPNLKGIVMKKAKDVFNVPAEAARAYDFDVPVFEWDGVHRDVPVIDPDYQFRPDLLMALLRSLTFNKPCWLNGHTGTGKSTAITQVAARLGWPVKVLNLDSEISRMELMGRDGLVQVNGSTTTQFIEGILPQALQGPYILIMDEIDFGRPDVMYAIQRVLEGNGLTLAEDGGRHVAPHPMFRMVATANTKGQGDDTGLYQGARIQSMAFLDRFTIWQTVSYMTDRQLDTLLKAKVKDLGDKERKAVVQYVQEHQVAFTQREVLTPISPRGAISLAEAIVVYMALMSKPSIAIEWAVKETILNRAPDQDAAVLKGITDRCFQ